MVQPISVQTNNSPDYVRLIAQNLLNVIRYKSYSADFNNSFADGDTLSLGASVVEADSSAGTINYNLPSIQIAPYKQYSVRRNGANNVTLTCNGSDTFMGFATATLATDGDCYTFTNDGISNWFLI